jgi:hypothetical protein
MTLQTAFITNVMKRDTTILGQPLISNDINYKRVTFSIHVMNQIIEAVKD